MILRYEREVKTLKLVLADKPNEGGSANFIVRSRERKGVEKVLGYLQLAVGKNRQI